MEDDAALIVPDGAGEVPASAKELKGGQEEHKGTEAHRHRGRAQRLEEVEQAWSLYLLRMTLFRIQGAQAWCKHLLKMALFRTCGSSSARLSAGFMQIEQSEVASQGWVHEASDCQNLR